MSQPKSLAIAYSTQRRSKKAKGSTANESAASERRPMPEERDKDAHMTSENSSRKPPKDDTMTSRPDREQSTKGSTQRLKHPKMVPQSLYSVRLRDEEDHLERSEAPAAPAEQPPRHDDEKQPKRQGPDASSLHMKKMAEGGSVHLDEMMEHQDNALASEEARDADMNRSRTGTIEADRKRHLAFNIEAQRHDMEAKEHHRLAAEAYKRHKESEPSDAMDEDQPDDAPMDDEGAEIASILSKRYKFADGGEVDLSRNADEDPNEEDQMSFEALKKENYSESEGLDDLDQPEDSNTMGDIKETDSENEHDEIEAIHRRIAKRKAAPR